MKFIEGNETLGSVKGKDFVDQEGHIGRTCLSATHMDT